MICHVWFHLIHLNRRTGKLTSPFYRGNEQDSERLYYLPKIKQLVSGRTRTLVCLTLRKTLLWWELGQASFEGKGGHIAKQLFVSRDQCLTNLCTWKITSRPSSHSLEMRVELFFMLQNKTSKQKCLSFLPGSAFSSNSVAILECAEEDKHIYQIVGKQDFSRTQ